MEMDHGEMSFEEQLNMAAAERRLQKRLSVIKHRIVVMSGKGGVGKSTVAVNLAVGLAAAGKRTALVDVDVHGPSVPRLLNLEDAEMRMENEMIKPAEWSANLGVVSLGFFLPPDQAVVWRGPVKTGFIEQCLAEVDWGERDYMVIDCPPGTGDEPLSVLQKLGEDAHALVVTTPQAVAVDDVRRSINFCHLLNIPVLGIVENMSGVTCTQCGNVEPLFGSGGGALLAAEFDLPLLASIPLDARLSRAGDLGKPFYVDNQDKPAGQAFQKVVEAALALDTQ